MRGDAPSVLLVDNDLAFLHATSSHAEAKGFCVATASTVRDASLLMAQAQPLDLVLVDLALPDGSGWEIIRRAGVSGDTAVVVMTRHLDSEVAMQAARLHIDDYMVKPLDDGRLNTLFDCAARRAARRITLGTQADHCGGLIGASARMHQLFKQIRHIAASQRMVWLHGERGTGKALAAETVHALSGRSGRFISVHGSAMPPDALRRGLFGYARGSFNGASRDHAGYLEQAQHGTLFLDGLSDMPPPLQTAALRVVETRAVTRFGARTSRPLDVRVIAACQRDPWLAMRDGQLRRDVYDHLCGASLAMPPLRERGDDAVLLAMHFLGRLNKEYRTHATLTAASMQAIRTYRWPGNVRELQHVVQRAYLMADNENLDIGTEIGRRETRDHAHFGEDWTPRTLQDIERHAIEQTLLHCGHDKTRAAKLLGISVKTIYNKLMRYRESDSP